MGVTPMRNPHKVLLGLQVSDLQVEIPKAGVTPVARNQQGAVVDLERAPFALPFDLVEPSDAEISMTSAGLNPLPRLSVLEFRKHFADLSADGCLHSQPSLDALPFLSSDFVTRHARLRLRYAPIKELGDLRIVPKPSNVKENLST